MSNSTLKKCSRCKILKCVEEFNRQKDRRDGYQSFCRVCSRARFKGYYEENKESVRANTERKRAESKLQCYTHVAAHFCAHPCIDCGNKDIRVLEFDHLDSDLKRNGVMKLVNGGASLQAVVEEMDKCEVRCKNCHTIKTYERMGGSWHNQFLGS